MEITISLPEDIYESLRDRWGDVPRHALEAIAVEGYRTGALSEAQVRRLLGLETRFEVHALLKEHRVPSATRKPIWRKTSPLSGVSESCLADDCRRGQRAPSSDKTKLDPLIKPAQRAGRF